MIRTTSCFAALACTGALAAPLESNFDAGTEGWLIQTRTNPSAAFTVVATYAPQFVSDGGDTDGFIQELDPDNQWSFFLAPPAWLGDRSDCSLGELRFSVRTSSTSFPDGRLVVLIGAGGQVISYDTGIPPVNTWTKRVVPLKEGDWRSGADATGAPVLQLQIDAVLGNLEALLIGMEYGSDLLEEQVGLDSVRLTFCPADVNNDGQATPADFTAWLACFNNPASAPFCDRADVNNSGSIDPADFTAWLAAFNAGCS